MPPWAYHPSALKSFSIEEGIVLSVLHNNTAIPTLQLFTYCFLAYIVYKLLIYPQFLSPLRSLPQPKGGYPLLGHALSRFQQPLGKTYLHFMNTVPNQGLILFRDLFHTDHLLLTSPEALAEILIRKPYHFEKPPEIRLFTSRILGGGLLTTTGAVHKMQRRNVMPNFTLRNTRRLAPLFWERSCDLVTGVRRELDLLGLDRDGVVDMNVWATKITLDIFGEAALGLQLGLLRGGEHPIERAYEGAFRSTPRKDLLFVALSCGLRWVVENVPWKMDREFDDSTEYLRGFCRGAIQQSRRRQEEEQQEKEKGLGQGFEEEQSDLLSKMLASGKFTDEELVDQFLTFLAAGHETVAATFGWTIHLLARHPDIQSRLRSELRLHASLCGTQISESLESLPLLHGVCNEAIRMYPSIPVTPRIATRETSILNYTVPKDTRIMIAPCAINRAPHLWGPSANEFMPERWIDADGGMNKTGGAESVFANLTFLHGAHGCIGADYARAELRAMVAALVGAFEMEIGAEECERVVVRGRLATRPGDEEGRLLVRLRPVPE
ncbi:cytochrome P450 [Aspergillus steynii IBT 23096]|uniref:Cytochrome P450 n=1 Tax=Aspergillus steynii IBT 23096 TaxID=1392250 RepID=A0A2I2FY91_9EURO|nr:cytochrome P450 [Aspergillus steynii IBT 23096]PLB45592.1 cytochrome P450 [Aspergillus steynii IBT 23096]